MKKAFIILVGSMLLSSCATLILPEETPPMALIEGQEGEFTTKAEVAEPQLSKEQICNILQTSRIYMLINHVIFKDGRYIQSLTEKDMMMLGIKDEEYTFINEYVQKLNHAKRDQIQ